MGLGRLIIIVAIVWLLFFLYRRFKTAQLIANAKTRTTASVNDVKKCKICGLHIPENEAITTNGNYYCCRSHMERDLHS